MDRWGTGLENGVERDRHQFGLTKRYKEIEVDRQEIETNGGGYAERIRRSGLKEKYLNLDKQEIEKGSGG